MDKIPSALRDYFVTDFDGWDDGYICSDIDEENWLWDDAVLAVQIGDLPIGTRVHQLAFNAVELKAYCYNVDDTIDATQQFTLTPVS